MNAWTMFDYVTSCHHSLMNISRLADLEECRRQLAAPHAQIIVCSSGSFALSLSHSLALSLSLSLASLTLLWARVGAAYGPGS